MPILTNFTDERILYAANLNSAFANTVNVAGDTIGSLTILGDLVVGGSVNFTVSHDIAANSALNLSQSAYGRANAAFASSNAVNTYANSAFSVANSATVLAQAAFNKANTGTGGTLSYQQSIITSNGLTINSATSLTVVGNNTILLSANLGNTTQAGIVQLNDTVLSTSTALAATANAVNATLFFSQTNMTAINNYAVSGYGTANTASTLAQAAFDKANVGGGSVNQTIITANGITVNNGTTLTVSGNVTVIYSANLGNTTKVGVVQLNDTVLSTSATLAATANSVNTAWSYAQTSFITANAVNTYATSGFGIANSALNLSQSAFNRANSGGSSGGTQTILTANGITVNNGTSISVAGNNTVILSANLGNTTQVGIVQLNDTVTSTSVALGATANAVNTAWATANAAFINSNAVNTFAASGFGIANSALNLSQSAFLQANAANILAGGAFEHSNAAFISSNDVNSYANTGYAIANSALNYSHSAFNRANISFLNQTTYISSNGLTTNALTTLTIAGNNTVLLSANLGNTTQAGIVQLSDSVLSTSAILGATANAVNTAWSYAQTSFITANAVNTFAGSAYGRANAAIQNQLTIISSNGITTNSATTLTLVGNNTVLLSANIGNTTQVGLVQLNDTVTSTSVALGATANAVNTVWSTAKAAFTQANSSSATVNDTFTSTSTTQAATANVANTIWNATKSAFTTANAAVIRSGDTMTGQLTVTGANVVAANLVTSGVVNSAVILVNPVISNANYILTMKDSGTIITFSNSSTTLVNVNNTLLVGFRVVLTQIGTGSVKIQAGAGVTLNPRIGSNNTTLGQYSSASIFSYATNAFIIDGSIS